MLQTFNVNSNRGVVYWTDNNNDQRIFYTAGSSLYAVNAKTGKLVTSFGQQGIVDLHNDLDRDVTGKFITSTSPGIIYKNLLIMGSRVEESAGAAPGHIRAYDVRTGKRKWIFHTIPHPGEFGYETWEDPVAYKHIGGANVWGGFALDEKRGILFAPTGSAAFDFYGGKRKGQNLFANSLLALDVATGKRIWHYQIIRHDLWDWDLPTAPALVTIHKDGRKINAVVQPTKHGMLYVFDRQTGVPVYPIQDVKVDATSELTREKVWPTQPVSTVINPFVRQEFNPGEINPYLPDSSKQIILNQLRGYRYGKMFIPPGKKTAVVLPGLDGGANGVARVTILALEFFISMQLKWPH